jgi:hypothetical protein
MKLKIFIASLAAMAATGCVFHHEVKSAPESDRMEFAVGAKAAPADSIGRHN